MTTFISGMSKRKTRGNKIEKVLKNDRSLKKDKFWVENEYFGSNLS